MRFLIALCILTSFTIKADYQKYAPIVIEASIYVGVDPVLMLAITHKETRFRNVAAAAGGTAEGLMQITDRTWQHLLNRYANDYIVALDASKYEPWSNAVMAAAYVKENQEGLRKLLKREPTYGEIYMAHLLGLRGVSDLLRANLNDCSTNVVAYAIKRNSRLFKKSDGTYRTVRQFRDYMNWKFSKVVDMYDGLYTKTLLAGF